MQTEIEQKLKNVIEAGLKDGFADLETLPNGHISGHVVSSEFVGLDYASRRERIRKVLVDKLSPHELVSVSTLLTYTPDEWSVVSSDLATGN